MKCFITVAVLLITVNLVDAQDLPMKDGKVFFEFIDSIPLQKDTMFDKVKLFLAGYYKNAKTITQVDDKANGELLLKPYLNIEEYRGAFAGKHPTLVTVALTIRDYKVRLRAYDIFFDGSDPIEVEKKIREESKHKDTKESWGQVTIQIAHQINYLRNSLLKELQKKDDF